MTCTIRRANTTDIWENEYILTVYSKKYFVIENENNDLVGKGYIQEHGNYWYIGGLRVKEAYRGNGLARIIILHRLIYAAQEVEKDLIHQTSKVVIAETLPSGPGKSTAASILMNIGFYDTGHRHKEDGSWLLKHDLTDSEYYRSILEGRHKPKMINNKIQGRGWIYET